jgi:hypothetical protein
VRVCAPQHRTLRSKRSQDGGRTTRTEPTLGELICAECVSPLMALVSVVTGVLVFLLALSLGMSYLIYVRIQDLRQEVERMRSKVEVTDEELDQIESSLDSIKV